ncbi:MAG: hypothetical protein DWI24_11055 [Planctomycetota bacterium]|nr:MAG: hypothetical protein DWI24_11055 [Planctomycetota bacterium]
MVKLAAGSLGAHGFFSTDGFEQHLSGFMKERIWNTDRGDWWSGRASARPFFLGGACHALAFSLEEKALAQAK